MPEPVVALTCRDIQRALVGNGTNCLWSPHHLDVAFNTTGVAGWEADILLIHRSGWAWEVEVKISVADFRREFKTPLKVAKHEWLLRGWRDGHLRGRRCSTRTIVRQFYFAFPIEIYEKVKDEIPEYAGVILLDPERVDGAGRIRPWIERKGKDLPARRSECADRAKLLESVYHRSWRLREPLGAPDA